MIQSKALAMTEVAWSLRTSKGGGRMKRLFSFVSKVSDFISKLSDFSWLIIIFILFITIFLFIIIGIMKC